MWYIKLAHGVNLQSFLDNPSLEAIEKCRKDELLKIATHFRISITKQSLKKEKKAEVIDRLVELDILPDVDRSEVQHVIETGKKEVETAMTEAEADVGAVLPPFEPFSPGTPSL